MRFILFYSGIESFNYFTDEIQNELKSLGHDTFILDLRDANNAPGHSLKDLLDYTKSKVHAAIGYDQMPCIGSAYVDLWNDLDIPVISIFMDPPYRFGDYNLNLPQKYIRFCCDIEHVTWCKRFHSDTMPNVYFLPHAATIPDVLPPFWEDKKFDVLFSGTYYSPDSYISTIKEKYDVDRRNLILDIIDFMVAHPAYSFNTAVDRILSIKGYNADDNIRLQIMNSSEEADWFIRMYYREKVIGAVLSSGIQLHVLGRGWENYPNFSNKSFHHISQRVAFASSLDYIANSKVNINIMPWYKDGTHDRVLNTLLRNSVPLTDPSLYMKEHFNDKESIFYYELDKLDRLPTTLVDILSSPSESKSVIEHGKTIVMKNYTLSSIVNELIKASNAFIATYC
jgi:hypothetical protein